MRKILKFKTQLIAFVYAMLVAILFVGCDKNAPADSVNDTQNMIVYYIQTDSKEGYKYEYRLNDGENDIGFKFYSNRVLAVGDTLRFVK